MHKEDSWLTYRDLQISLRRFSSKVGLSSYWARVTIHGTTFVSGHIAPMYGDALMWPVRSVDSVTSFLAANDSCRPQDVGMNLAIHAAASAHIPTVVTNFTDGFFWSMLSSIRRIPG